MIKQRIKVTTAKGSVYIGVKIFEELLDANKIIHIDYNNILAELLLFPKILNMVGVLKVEATNETAKEKVNFYVWRAKKEAAYKRETSAKLTVSDINNHIFLLKDYKIRRAIYDEAKKRQGIVETLYWSATEKLKNLKTISDKLEPNDLIIDPEDIPKGLKKMYGINSKEL